MPFDFKKEFKEQYTAKSTPHVLLMPTTNYIAIRGKGDPNAEGGEYKAAIEVLYTLAYTLKMSYKTDKKIDGFYEYVVPPLEGLWWQDGYDGFDNTDKNTFQWIAMIRLPEFITKEDYDWAVETGTKKKKIDCSKAIYFNYNEGLCAQVLHIGPYDEETATIEKLTKFIKENGYETDLRVCRYHHEIYLSDPRRTDPSKCKTIIRLPIIKPE